MDEFLSKLLWCENCSLSKTRTNVVVGSGNPNADILFVMESPTENEDKSGKAGVSIHGILLNDMLIAAGIDEQSYVTHAVKCAPPDNRKPSEIEMKTCLPWLNTQVKDIKPKAIVGLGTEVSTRIKKDFLIFADQGNIYTLKDGIRFMGIYPPEHILRNPDMKNMVIEQLIKLKSEIN